jgi:hypothetical protein
MPERTAPMLRLAMAGDLGGAPLRGYDEFPSNLSVAVVPVWTVLDCPAPLPANITSGEYLVTNSRGTVGRLIVPATNGSSTGQGAEVTAITAGPVAWVFLRQGDVRGESLGVANVPVKPLYLNRKFDFSGAPGQPDASQMTANPTASTLR